jgi:adenylate kinase
MSSSSSSSSSSAAAAPRRVLPNILVCGTPGSGKSSLCEAVLARAAAGGAGGAALRGLRHVVLGELAKSRAFHAGRDEALDTLLLDEASEDRLLDELEPLAAAGGLLLEHHSCALFPERWFELVLVLRTDNTALFDRLVRRGYSARKVQENVECEIMRVVADEALASYEREGVVHELQSETPRDIEENAARVEQWLAQWRRDNGFDDASASASGGGGGGAGEDMGR